jgi:HK97 family phage major capsid protein
MDEQMKELLAEIEAMKTELRSANDEQAKALNDQIEELRGQFEAMEQRAVEANRPGAGESLRDADADKHGEMFARYARTGDMELRTLSGATDEEGGVFLPTQMAAEIKSKAANLNEIRRHCYVGRTGMNSVLVPSLARPKAGYGTVTPTEQELNSGFTRLDVHDCKALAVIPENTLADSSYDLNGKLTSQFSDALSEEESRAFVMGSGVNEPLGIVSKETKANAVTTAASGSLGADGAAVEDIINKALYSLKKTYRRNAKLICNSNTEAELAKVRDANGNKLLTKDGDRTWFNGTEIVTCEDMDDVAAGKYPIVVGDLRQFEVYDRSDISVKRLTGGNYDTSSTVGFLLKARHAAGVTQVEAFVPVKVKA